MGYALRKEPEEPFELETEIDGGGPGGGWSDARLIAWLQSSVELCEVLPEFAGYAAEAKRRGLEWY
jgi:hypothetical protein